MLPGGTRKAADRSGKPIQEVRRMQHIQSSVTELPASCKSAADRAAQVLAEEDRYADLSESCRKKLTELEEELSRETKERVALVAYRI